eukprot:TRINITY_DN14864_c0_g1_i3.p1 TRINITY_DN14864_c0_g1~~TRINITY_DN14864_c0_g1_i3.p1  ORF type:complete len:685 (+),score=74.96 TRINITY_DN14864_c0_g1_i3:62-2116(+)
MSTPARARAVTAPSAGSPRVAAGNARATSPKVAGSTGAEIAPTHGRIVAALGDRDHVSIEELLKPLNSNDPHLRQASCQALARPSLRGDPRVASALIARLEDRDQYVRQAAANTLGQVSRRGDESSITALISHCADSDPGVRRVSAIALGQVVQRGNSAATAGLLARLEDRDGGVRRAALKSLEKVTDKGDSKVLGALFSRTTDGEAFVRHTAVEVLSRLAEEGDSNVVSRLLVLLDTDRDARVRWAATEALGRLAVRGDSRVLTALLARLDDEADSVRRAAANALGHVTFAPLEELRMQERHIAEVEFRGAHEVATRDKTITELEERHSLEVACLQRRVDELEDKLRREVEDRDRRIKALEDRSMEMGWLSRVAEFMPHAVRVTQFLETLPSLAGPESHGIEVTAPVWALRCVRASGTDAIAKPKRGSLTGHDDAAAPDGKDKRWLLTLFELFEQLSTGRVTSMELTERKPLDVYVHRGDDDAWGLYCVSRHRMLALLMRQACVRSELMWVRCVIRPKNDQSFWGWQWTNFYDGGDGLFVTMAGNSGRSSRFSAANQKTDSCGTPQSSKMSLQSPRSRSARKTSSICGASGAQGASAQRKVASTFAHQPVGSELQDQSPTNISPTSNDESLSGASQSPGSGAPGRSAKRSIPTVTMELLDDTVSIRTGQPGVTNGVFAAPRSM